MTSSPYHDRTAHYARSWWHRFYLERLYEQSYRWVKRLGADPLVTPGARVLLCGTASAETTHTFERFVRTRCPSATLVVIDRSMQPLRSSLAKCPSAAAVQADALALPFSDAFDLIETDFLLQFVPERHRAQLFSEWARVLRPGGALMTRDYVLSRAPSDALLNLAREALFRRTLGQHLPGSQWGDVAMGLRGAGFRFRIERVRVAGRRLPLVGLIAAVRDPTERYDLRAPRQDEWPQVRALISRTPMSATLPLTFERAEARAHAYPHLGGEPVDVVCAESSEGGADRVCGSVHGHIQLRRVLTRGTWSAAPVLYAGDFRVDPSRQSRGIARAMLLELRRRALAGGVEYGFCLVNEGNARMLHLLRDDAPEFRAQVVRTFTTASRVLLTRPSPRPGVIERFDPSTADFERLALNLSKRLLAAVVDGAALRHFAEHYPEVRWYRLAGDSAIAFALWDMTRVRRFALGRSPPVVKAFRSVWNRLAGVSALARLPDDGASWRSAEVTLWARDALPQACGEAMAFEAFQMGCQTIDVIESGLEPTAPFRMRGPCYRMKTHVVGLAVEPTRMIEWEGLPVMVDLGFF